MKRYFAIPVWDGTVRLCHWVNAVSVVLLLVLGAFRYFGDGLSISERGQALVIDFHALVGIVFAVSLLLRVIYLFVGPLPAHWRDVVPHGREQWRLLGQTVRYYLTGFRGECPLYFAHNPLAGIAYTFFFTIALVQVISGASIYLLGEGVATAHAHDLSAHSLEESWPPLWLVVTHMFGAVGILLFIISHLAALFIHDLREKRGLISSMVSGCKFFSEEECRRLGIESDRGREEGGEL